MFPARTLPLKDRATVNLYVWYEHSGYYAAYFSVEMLPLLADSEILVPGSFYGPFRSYKEAEMAGLSALKQLVRSAEIPTSSAAKLEISFPYPSYNFTSEM
ncbi:MAG: hypothetical protein WCS37_21520 [Chloroflexota bacterium]|nr:hypothetical protein [Chloroflexota bacterium]